jgi:hypothetical protein
MLVKGGRGYGVLLGALVVLTYLSRLLAHWRFSSRPGQPGHVPGDPLAMLFSLGVIGFGSAVYLVGVGGIPISVLAWKVQAPWKIYLFSSIAALLALKFF